MEVNFIPIGKNEALVKYRNMRPWHATPKSGKYTLNSGYYLEILDCSVMSIMILCNGSPLGHFEACSIYPSWYALNAAGSFLNICKIHKNELLQLYYFTYMYFHFTKV